MAKCIFPPHISNGYSTKSSSTSPITYTVVCNPGYTMSGSPTYSCDPTATPEIWTGDGKCEPWYIKDIWFWLLIGVGTLLAIAGITVLCGYCVRKYNRRQRVHPTHDRHIDSEATVGCCGGCCDYGGSCDVCGCIDYYRCCSLYGFCGYKGCCSFCCGCCRCCREPDVDHVHAGGSRDLPFQTRQLPAQTRAIARWNLWRKSPRHHHPVDNEVYDKVRK